MENRKKLQIFRENLFMNLYLPLFFSILKMEIQKANKNILYFGVNNSSLLRILCVISDF